MAVPYCVGLATTFHDPALAIVSPEGEIVFAESAERYLQNKRAMNCEPDTMFRIQELIETYCEPNSTFAVGTSWSRRATRWPLWLSACNAVGLLKPDWISRLSADLTSPLLLLRQYQTLHMLLCVRSTHLKAGANLAVALRNHFGNRNLSFAHFDHHLTHATMACYASPFDKAVCCVVDGTGEVGSLSYYAYEGGALRLLHRHRGLESLGALYMLVTELCGFSSFKGEEWKVMGLASYGRFDPAIAECLRSIIRVDQLDIRYPMLNQLRDRIKRLGAYQRTRDTPPLEAANLAHTWQRVFSDVMNALLRCLQQRTGADNLVLAGGCALNSSYAGEIISATGFERLFIPSAPADDGTAIGAALLAYQRDRPLLKRPGRVLSAYLGSTISRRALEHLLQFGPAGKLRHCPGTVHREAAAILAQGSVIGWFQGRAEFGPRALGNRSILADPRPVTMKDRLNAQVKYREDYRPFAPSILHEHGPAYFEEYQESPYMERTLRFRDEVRKIVPAVVHNDGTGRLQTVKREWNAGFYDLISAFHQITGIPLLLNTSFNVMGKPIVHSLEDAVGVLYTSGLDALVIDDYVIEK